MSLSVDLLFSERILNHLAAIDGANNHKESASRDDQAEGPSCFVAFLIWVGLALNLEEES
jgi:hypothetical protein